jgi:hypothetical protein
MNTHLVYRKNPLARMTVLLWISVLLMLAVSRVSAQEAASADAAPITDKAAALFVDRFDDLINEQNLELVDTIFAEDFVSHLPDAPELDRDGWAAYQGSLRASAPDATQQTHRYTRLDNLLILYVTLSNLSSMNSIQVFRFNDEGLAVENWTVLSPTGVYGPAWGIPAQLRK